MFHNYLPDRIIPPQINLEILKKVFPNISSSSIININIETIQIDTILESIAVTNPQFIVLSPSGSNEIKITLPTTSDNGAVITFYDISSNGDNIIDYIYSESNGKTYYIYKNQKMSFIWNTTLNKWIHLIDFKESKLYNNTSDELSLTYAISNKDLEKVYINGNNITQATSISLVVDSYATIQESYYQYDIFNNQDDTICNIDGYEFAPMSIASRIIDTNGIHQYKMHGNSCFNNSNIYCTIPNISIKNDNSCDNNYISYKNNIGYLANISNNTLSVSDGNNSKVVFNSNEIKRAICKDSYIITKDLGFAPNATPPKGLNHYLEIKNPNKWINSLEIILPATLTQTSLTFDMTNSIKFIYGQNYGLYILNNESVSISVTVKLFNESYGTITNTQIIASGSYCIFMTNTKQPSFISGGASLIAITSTNDTNLWRISDFTSDNNNITTLTSGNIDSFNIIDVGSLWPSTRNTLVIKKDTQIKINDDEKLIFTKDSEYDISNVLDNNGIYVTSLSTGGLYYSTNGTAWVQSNITSGIYTIIAYGNGKYIASSYSSSLGILYSYDGMTWTASNITSGVYYNIKYVNDKFIAGSYGNTGLYYSTDEFHDHTQIKTGKCKRIVGHIPA